MKKILVTGGSKGIGLECVKRFLLDGWHVICCSRSQSTWDECIIKFPLLENVEYHVCDIANEESVNTLFTIIKDKHSLLDAAVNNAAPKLTSQGDFKDVTLDALRETVSSDLMGTVMCLKHELNLIRNGGSIVNVTSVNGIRPIPGASMYGASKQAIESLTKSIALEAIADNIRINSVAPGVTWTPRWEERERDNPNIRQEVESEIPANRFARPDEIVNAIYWLVSEEANYVIGHTLIVDGGLSLK